MKKSGPQRALWPPRHDAAKEKPQALERGSIERMSETAAIRLAKGLLLLFGAGFALLGARYFIDPSALTVESDVMSPTAKAMMEIRTVYGGLFVGVGLAVAAAAFRPTLLPAGLALLILVAGCVAIARLAAIALGQAPDLMFATLLLIEIVGAALAALALRRLGQGGR